MKQSTGSVSSTTMLTPYESEVLEILVQLPSQILELESRCRFPFTWGHKRRRSAIRVTPSLSPSHQPSSSSPKAEAPSPATPLSFSPSESEEKPTLLRKNVSLKRKREHYLKIIEELTKHNDLLHGEIKNVKCYFDQLKDFNLKLKARKQELSLVGPNQADPVHEQLQLQFPGTTHSLPLMVNQTAQPPEISDNEGVAQFQSESEHECGQPTTSLGVPSSSSSGSTLGNDNNMGPIGIPDLNLPLDAAESCEALDVSLANKNLSRAMAAQARQKRIQIYRVKIKNPIANSKTRYSCR